MKSGKMKSTTFHYIQSVSFLSPRRVELNASCRTFILHLVESRTVQIVFSSVLNSVEDTLVECQLNTVEIIQSLSSVHLFISGVQPLWEIALT